MFDGTTIDRLTEIVAIAQGRAMILASLDAHQKAHPDVPMHFFLCDHILCVLAMNEYLSSNPAVQA